MNPRVKTFLVVEDHPEVAENNEKWLRRLEPDSWCIRVSSPPQAIARLSLELPDLIVVDLLFGTVSGQQSAEGGLGLLNYIFERYTQLNTLVYSSEYRLISPLIPKIHGHNGGFSVANKLELREIFLKRARIALDGGKYIPQDLQQPNSLTGEDLELLNLLCKEGLTDQEIADRLRMGKRTVQDRIRVLKAKFGISDDDTKKSRIPLCMKAVEQGMILR